MFKFSGKKGVSPIIAAILLVVITIAIGATTMAFIRSLTDTNLEAAKVQSAKISCGTDVQLEIPIVNSQYQICYYNSTGAINLLIHNIGTKDIKGFSLTAILTNGTVITNDKIGSSYEIAKNAYVSVNLTPIPNVDYSNTSAGIVSQWRVEPKIQGDPGKELTICTDSAIVRDNTKIRVC